MSYIANRLKSLFILGLCALFASTAWANASNTRQILIEVASKIDIISETDPQEKEYLKVLNEGAAAFKKMLADPQYDLAGDLMNGKNALYVASRSAYYPILEVLLADPRGLALINRSYSSYSPLDAAKMREQSNIAIIINPLIQYNAQVFTGLRLQQLYYDSKIQPYTKTIALLEKHGAKTTRSVKASYQLAMDRNMDNIPVLEAQAPDDQTKLMIKESAQQLKQHMKWLKSLTTKNDEETYKKVHERAVKELGSI
jgi:hypothetical protein